MCCVVLTHTKREEYQLMGYRETFEEWISNDYFDAKTKEELLAIRNDEKEVEDRFYKDLEFGTGGLRGVIGAGINRMNYVEGIGLDSSASGFTLNYLMGWAPGLAIFDLSHVIEDGEIIYKGMGYRPGVVSGVDEAVADQSRRPLDENYYDLTGRAVGKDVPTAPGIYIHQGKKICVR